MRYKKMKTSLCMLAALILTAVFIPAVQPVFADQSDLDITSRAVSTSAVKLSWAGNKDELKKAVKWEIRQAVVDDDSGKAGSYKKVKTLNKGSKTYTVKNLDANTNYRFEISGFVKKNDKVKKAYVGKEDNFTGIVVPKWDDHALADDKVSSDMIRISFIANRGGLEVKGYEIQRRSASKKDSEFKKIASVKDTDKSKSGEITYDDKSVKKGGKYQYRVCAYTGSGKRSAYSGSRTRMATRGGGKFTVKTKKLKKNVMVLCIKGNDGNADMLFDTHNTFFGDSSDENENPICIEAYSTDNKNWTKLKDLSPQTETSNVSMKAGKNFVVLKAGKKLYLKFAPVEDMTDLTELGRAFYSGNVSYNGFESDFNFTIRSLFGGEGKGSSKINER